MPSQPYPKPYPKVFKKEKKKIKTFTINQIIKVVESLRSREFEENNNSFGDCGVYTDKWIRKNELINILKSI